MTSATFSLLVFNLRLFFGLPYYFFFYFVTHPRICIDDSQKITWYSRKHLFSLLKYKKVSNRKTKESKKIQNSFKTSDRPSFEYIDKRQNINAIKMINNLLIWVSIGHMRSIYPSPTHQKKTFKWTTLWKKSILKK